MELSKEDLQLQNRIRDLADKSFKQNVFTFTGFLGLAEQDIFWKVTKEIRYVSYSLYGGMDESERKMVRFGSREELGYEEEFPIVCIHNGEPVPRHDPPRPTPEANLYTPRTDDNPQFSPKAAIATHPYPNN